MNSLFSVLGELSVYCHFIWILEGQKVKMCAQSTILLKHTHTHTHLFIYKAFLLKLLKFKHVF